MTETTLDSKTDMIVRWQSEKRDWFNKYSTTATVAFELFASQLVSRAEQLNGELAELQKNGKLPRKIQIDTELASKKHGGGLLIFDRVQLDYQLDLLSEPPELQLKFHWPGKRTGGPDLRLVPNMVPEEQGYRIVWRAEFSDRVFETADSLVDFCMRELTTVTTQLR